MPSIDSYPWAGGAPKSALNYSGTTTANGNPFKPGTQEFGEWEQQAGGGGAGPGAPAAPAGPSADDIQKATFDAIVQAYDRVKTEYFSKASEFDTKNPFAFDEALAKGAAKLEIDPYYDQKLGDFLLGVTTTRSRGVQDEKSLLTEINQDIDTYTGKSQFLVDRAVRQAEEGQADANLFDSGAAKALSGELKLEAKENQSNYMTGQERRIGDTRLKTGRLLEDLGNQERIGTRDINTSREFDILSDVKRQGLESAQRREYERNQYLGPAPSESLADFQRRSSSIIGA